MRRLIVFRWPALAPVLFLLGACNVEFEHSVIADPIDVRPFEGFWISAKDEIAYVLSIKVDKEMPRSASVMYVNIARGTHDVNQSALVAQATVINGLQYFEAAGAGEGKNNPPHRLLGRIYLGTTETPHDTNKLTICFPGRETMKKAIESRALEGSIKRDPQAWLPNEEVRVTASTAKLRAYFAEHPLICNAFDGLIFTRAQPHFVTSR